MDMDTSEKAMKFSNKRKYSAEDSPNTSKKKKFSKMSEGSRELVTNNKSFGNKNRTSEARNKTDFQKSKKFGKFSESAYKKITKKVNKKMLKSEQNTPTNFQSLFQSKNMKKTKKNEKLKKLPDNNIKGSTSNDGLPSPVGKKMKKGKKKAGKSTLNIKENSESDDEFSDLCISEENESDEEVIREEIQNSSIFKQIEKLMRKAPHLNPANASSECPQVSIDDEEDNSSDLNISAESDDEESPMETDDQDVSSSESNYDDSQSKKETINKKQNAAAKRQEKNILPENKKSNFVENVTEITGFDRTPKDAALRKKKSDKGKKGEISSNLRNKMLEKLAGAKFRFLNEKLYTQTGKDAFKYFQDNSEDFNNYHSGYRLQVSKWPMNPVNEIIADIQKLKKTFVIADLGCGEAKIAQTFPGRTIHSFDLVPLNKFVKACDISKVPLPNESVDVAVFCLSLMGTNLKDYLCEAFRILKVGGILKIAEVESRIEDLGNFINYLKSVGFTLAKKNTKHKMFVFLDLKKEKQKCKLGKLPSLSLRPCLYKKR